MAKCYTGIGSRQTPADVLALMTAVAAQLGHRGWTLRSGGADGADEAFFTGTVVRDDPKPLPREIFIPWDGFNGLERSLERGIINPTAQARIEVVQRAGRLAEKYHPAWQKCSDAARLLHRRNVFQVGGLDLQTRSRFVICWTPRGYRVGGTALAIRIAEAAQIPVFNLAKTPDRARIEAWLAEPLKSAA